MKTLRKTLSVLILGAVFVSAVAAQYTPRSECGTKVTEKQKAAERARLANPFSQSVAPQANRPYQIPMTIHIVRPTNGIGGLTLAELSDAMRTMNALWLPTGVQFYQHGSIDYIDNDLLFNLPDQDFWRDVLRQTNPVGDTINVYFTNVNGLCGQSSFTTNTLQGILVSNDCTIVSFSPSTFAHEVGHYFDLYHTHETILGVECPSGNNCAMTGDLLCDTAADPELNYETNVSASCAWTGTAALPGTCDLTPYNPPTRNILSYSRRTCRDTFTPNQITRALGTLTTAGNRVNLINARKRFVAPDGGANADCTFQSPCNSINRAVQMASSGDSIFVLAGNYSGAISPQNKLVTIRKWNTDAGDPFLTEE